MRYWLKPEPTSVSWSLPITAPTAPLSWPDPPARGPGAPDGHRHGAAVGDLREGELWRREYRRGPGAWARACRSRRATDAGRGGDGLESRRVGHRYANSAPPLGGRLPDDDAEVR